MPIIQIRQLIRLLPVLFLGSSLHAGDFLGDMTADPRDFIGYWQIEEAAGDTCYIIVKSGGHASCFWAGNSMDHIEKGRWGIRNGQLVITWDNGFRYALEKKGSRTLMRHTYAPGADLDGPPEATVVGNQYDKRFMGYLAIERGEESADEDDDFFTFETARSTPSATVRNQAPSTSPFIRSNYLGYWQVESKQSALWGLFGSADAYYINISRDGRVQSMLREQSANLYGYWVEEDGNLKIFWDDGRKQLIRPVGSQFEIFTYSAKDDFTDNPDGRQFISKLDTMEAKGVFQDMAMKFIAVGDIVGYWVGQMADVDTSPTIEIERWGKARYYPYGIEGESIPGEWQMHSEEVVISIEDGRRFVLINRVDDTWRMEAYNEDNTMTGLADRENSVRRLKMEEVDRISLRNQQTAVNP